MGVFETSGLCVPISDYEENYLLFTEDHAHGHIGAAQLVANAAGTETVRWNVATAFECVEREKKDERDFPLHWQPIVEKYQAETGRTYPPVFRVKIRVEAEIASEEEIEAYWKEKQAD